MREFQPREFTNCYGRRVLDVAGQQGMGGVTGLGSATEVRCGLVLEALVRHAPHLAAFQLDDIIRWCHQLRDGVESGQTQEAPVAE